jgi:hypothetical protein
MTGTEFLSLAIVGAFVSVLVQYIKSSGFSHPQVLVMAAALGAATAYYFIGDTAAWQAFLSVLLIANGIYSYLIKPFEA